MYLLTKKQGDIESGTYASIDKEGTTIVQFFVDKDDAMTYCVQLEALGQELFVTETPDTNIDKMCDILGYAYSVVQPGEIVIPRVETQQKEFYDSL